MNNLSVRTTMYITVATCLCLMLTSDVVAATQELTPQIFSSNFIDLNTCDWNEPMCNLDSFIYSGLDEIKKLHELKCVRNTDMEGTFRGYDACNPQHLSTAWYRDECLNKSFIYYGKSCEDLLEERITCRYEEMCPNFAHPCNETERLSNTTNGSLVERIVEATTVPLTTSAHGGKAYDELVAVNKRLIEHQWNLYVAIGLLTAATAILACLCVWLARCQKKLADKVSDPELSSDSTDSENTSLTAVSTSGGDHSTSV